MFKGKPLLFFLFLLANLFIVLFFWQKGSVASFDGQLNSYLLIIGRLSGLLAALFIMTQLLLIGRVLWIERIFGFDNLAKIHKKNGQLIIILVLIHPVLLTYSYAVSSNITYLSQFTNLLSSYEEIKEAIIAVILLIVVVVVSIYKSRSKLKYEFWYFIHLFIYPAVILSFGHQLKLGGDFLTSPAFRIYWYFLFIFSFGNFFYYRFFKPAMSFIKHRFYIDNIVKETNNVYSIYIRGHNLDYFKITGGQFMIFRFLQKKYWTQAHPFSLSCTPNIDYLRITVKNVGDFTSQISGLKKGTNVIIEGALGLFHVKQGINKCLFLAGGIGITPIRAMIGQLGGKSDIILLYSEKRIENIVFKKELDGLSSKFSFPIHYLITDDEKYQGEKGRIDKGKLRRLVKDLKEREIYLCGPGQMLTDLKKTLLALGISQKSIHSEEFTL